MRTLSLLAVCAALAGALPARSVAQGGASVSGVIRDRGGDGVRAAVVTLRSAAGGFTRGAETDSAGSFRIDGVPTGHYALSVDRIGYDRYASTIDVGVDGLRLEIVMREQAVALPGVFVDVEASRRAMHADAGASVEALDRPRLKSIPGIAESDVLRAIQVLPGVVSTSDFSAAYNVRGGSADQNLILLDGFPIYNPFHLGGFFSVFNADMVGRADLLTGGFPARVGGRVSSVLDIRSDVEGENGPVSAGLSVLAARAAVGTDLPLGAAGLRDARARVSLRRSYFDQVLRPVFDFPYHLTDAQLAAQAWTGGGARISLTGYTGGDVLDLRRVDPDQFPLKVRWDWGNAMIGGTYERDLRGGGRVEARLGYTRFANAIRFPDFDDTRFDSRIGQAVLRLDATVPLTTSLGASFGLSGDRFAYSNLAETGGTTFRSNADRAWGTGTYAQAEWQTTGWMVRLGTRADGWLPESGTSRVLLSPRVAVKRFLGPATALNASAGRYTQFVHSLRDEDLPLGIDVWVTTGARAPVVVSDQAQIGFERREAGWRYSAEAYLRRFQGVVTNNAADDPNDPLDDLLSGTGRARGLDVMVERAQGPVRGWLTLSLLRTTRTFPDVLSGEQPPPDVTYAPVFDRRVEAELVLRYPLPWSMDGGLHLNVGTGLPYTKPAGSYTYLDYGAISGRLRLISIGQTASSEDPPLGVALGGRNAERYPPYHRLDVSFRRSFDRGWGRITAYLDVLNVYDRRNVLFYFYDFQADPPTRSGVSMFPLLPTLGAEVSF